MIFPARWHGHTETDRCDFGCPAGLTLGAARSRRRSCRGIRTDGSTPLVATRALQPMRLATLLAVTSHVRDWYRSADSGADGTNMSNHFFAAWQRHIGDRQMRQLIQYRHGWTPLDHVGPRNPHPCDSREFLAAPGYYVVYRSRGDGHEFAAVRYSSGWLPIVGTTAARPLSRSAARYLLARLESSGMAGGTIADSLRELAPSN